MEDMPAASVPQSRFQISWMLFKKSLQLMKDNPKLLLFPIVTAAATISIFGFFLVALIFQPMSSFRNHSAATESSASVDKTAAADTTHGAVDPAKAADDEDSREEHPELVIYGALAYFVSIFLATFFNVAFYHEIFDALDGKEVSVSD